MSLLYGGGVHGHALDAIQAWKEILLAAALLSRLGSSPSLGRLPFRPGAVDALALAYAAIVVLYARDPAVRARRARRPPRDPLRAPP